MKMTKLNLLPAGVDRDLYQPPVPALKWTFRLYLLVLFAATAARAADAGENFGATRETVGHHTNGLETPVNQLVTPAGTLVELAGIRPNALAHARSLRDFGEFTLSHIRWQDASRKQQPTFLDCYRDFKSGSNMISLWSEPSVESLRPHLATNTIGWNLNVPDVFRARRFIEALNEYEKRDALPDMILLWLPNDHTSGTGPGSPTPAAQVADNDLAFGQVVEAVSHSIFWRETCIFAVEDDPQNGWAHVSGYRTMAYVISPFTKRGVVVSTQYNQTSLPRTMELILGLPPMNQMDATATPMFDCFIPPGAPPDFTSFTAMTNQVPLDQMNPEPKKISDRQLRKDAYASARLPLDKEDQCPGQLLAHILWRALKGSQTPFPDWAANIVKEKD
jgi:hypothetical protein